MSTQDWLLPDWPAPASVRALSTTRSGGVSQGPWASLNTATHVGDDPETVAENRRRLQVGAQLPGPPLWLDQVHGTTIYNDAVARPNLPPQADGSVTRRPGQPLVVQTADCLPVLACNRQGTVVGAFHAGWKGLVQGILGAGLAAMGPAADLLVWIGPAIGADAYQVGPELRATFVQAQPAWAACFSPDRGDRWKFDLIGAARLELQRLGVGGIYGGDHCTWTETERWFSHRRQAPCGRQAALIWLER